MDTMLRALTSHPTGTAIRCEASHQAMGTAFTVVAYGSNASYVQEVAEEAFGEIDRLDNQLSHYKPASELSAINRVAAARAVIVEPGLFKLLQSSVRYSQDTGGAFDITVGPLMKAWGFFRGEGRLPSGSAVAEAMERVGYRHIILDPSTRRVAFERPGIELDLGGLGKGYAIDRAAEILRTYGIEQALISAGCSSLFALGAPPGEQGWRISIRDPFEAAKTASSIQLRNLALSVSGSYEQFFKCGGKTYTHVMDPRTGMPVENMLSTVVVSSSTADSDAVSTSLFVLGVDRSREYLKSHPDRVAFAYVPDVSESAFRRVTLHSEPVRVPDGCFVSVAADA
jgi:thiamine biosynthesis lipoprotein